jgi:hypothetical protein
MNSIGTVSIKGRDHLIMVDNLEYEFLNKYEKILKIEKIL